MGFTNDDDGRVVEWMAEKVPGLRVFPDEAGRMNRSLADVEGQALVVSQFTLYGDCRKGRRPSFMSAADPDVARPLYEDFIERLQVVMPERVQAGRFGADMQVALINDGPVTLLLER